MRTWKKNSETLEQAYGEKRPDIFNRPLIPPLIFFVGGILTGQFISLPGILLLIPIFLIIFIHIISPNLSNILRLSCFLTVFFLTGVFLVTTQNRPADLLPLFQGKRVIIEGTIVSPARTNSNIRRFELKAEKIFLDNRVTNVDEKVLVNVYNNPCVFPVGTGIRFPAYLKPFMNFNNPGSYDYELSMRLKMISCSASVSDGRYIVPMGKGNPGLILKAIEYFRKPVRAFLDKKLSPRDSSLYKALILGERESITKELREPFDITGMGHVLAVSGLHIGIIAWLSFVSINWTLSRSRILLLRFDIKKIAALFTCIPVVLYTGMAGFQVSGQRAMIMTLAYLISIIIDREKEIWSTLALSVFCILTIDPMAVRSISFQMTFLAVTGIVWLTPVFQSIITDTFKNRINNRVINRVIFYFTSMVAASLSAVIFLMPVIVYYFHRVSFVTIPANLLVIPLLAFIILPSGLLAILSLIFSPFMAYIFLSIGVQGVHLMMSAINYLSGFAWSCFWMVTPNIFEITLFYSILFCLMSVGKWCRIKYCLTLIILLGLADISYWIYSTRFNNDLRVTFIDVGQGSAAYVQFPKGKRMLVDGGGFRVGSFDTGRNIVAPFLFSRKILKIDYLVLSHPHPDHMNGLKFIASEFGPSEFWYNGESVDKQEFHELMDIVKSKNLKVYGPRDLVKGSIISGVEIELLHPSEEHPLFFGDDNRSVNNNSLVLRLSYMGRSILFTGDIEGDAESILLKRYGDNLESDVLSVPHHGSRYSSSRSFLDKVKPEISIISSRRGNRFGFPHHETLERLSRVGARIFRIDEKGAIIVTIGENKFDVTCWCK
ncbi:DNA internalization-related competence protein ComEC/Rec2 [Thermodesulfobacteriota bacterium]